MNLNKKKEKKRNKQNTFNLQKVKQTDSKRCKKLNFF
jgi:hypothetical protein